jgi:hypothetical protein
MSLGVMPVLRHVVVTAMHVRSAGRWSVRWWSLLTRVEVVLRGSSCRRALVVDGGTCCQMWGKLELFGCTWWSARHSREAGLRGMRRIYAQPMSLTITSELVKVTLCPAVAISWTQTRAVLKRLGTMEAEYEPMWAISFTDSVSMLPYRIEVPEEGWTDVVLSMRRRRGDVVIIAPLSITALGSCGDRWIGLGAVFGGLLRVWGR